MISQGPAFWGRYRGSIDPQNPLNTVYSYSATFFYANVPAPVIRSFSINGPAQLTRELYIELNWAPAPGLIVARIQRAGIYLCDCNGAECNFLDMGQFTSSTSGVRI